ncbi:MAG: hypothetical protein HY026_09285 [Deltaproteobacteria bacterium]|nr:hypothetical protein [Deltaproteobacteria bacterium]
MAEEPPPIFELIKSRRSIRKFAIDYIPTAGVWTPSGKNNQPKDGSGKPQICEQHGGCEPRCYIGAKRTDEVVAKAKSVAILRCLAACFAFGSEQAPAAQLMNFYKTVKLVSNFIAFVKQ